MSSICLKKKTFFAVAVFSAFGLYSSVSNATPNLTGQPRCFWKVKVNASEKIIQSQEQPRRCEYLVNYERRMMFKHPGIHIKKYHYVGNYKHSQSHEHLDVFKFNDGSHFFFTKE